MAIDELLTVVSPPDKPLDGGDAIEWDKKERQLGTALPSDYKDFIAHYGTGVLCGFIRVFNPFAQSEYTDLVSSAKRINSMNYSLKESEGQKFPFAVFPDPSGLLPWGTDDNGNYYYWLTEGQPDKWVVVVGAGRHAKWQRFDLPMTSFLTRAIRREVVCDIWPSDFPDLNDPDVGLFSTKRSHVETIAWWTRSEFRACRFTSGVTKKTVASAFHRAG